MQWVLVIRLTCLLTQFSPRACPASAATHLHTYKFTFGQFACWWTSATAPAQEEPHETRESEEGEKKAKGQQVGWEGGVSC